MNHFALHTRYQLLENLRQPVGTVGSFVFPGLIMLCFIVPNSAIAQNPVAATGATAQMALFSVSIPYMFNLAANVSEDRGKPWEPFLRTLPVGPIPRLTGRVLSATIFGLLGMVPVVLIALLFTAATASILQVLLAVVALVVTGIPFMMMGLSIGYLLSLKAAIPVVQVVLFPMAFAGGLFIPPSSFPAWLDVISQALPTRAARDLVATTVGDFAIQASTIPVIVGWSVALVLLTGFAYRRDQDRRFR